MAPKHPSMSLPDEGFVREAQLVPHILPFSVATLRRMVRDGEFPRAVRLSKRIVAWRVDEIREWISARVPGAKP